VVTQPAHSRPRVAPVVGVAPEAAPVRGGGGAGTQLAALLSASHILQHTVHCLEDAAAHLPEVAEAAHVLYAVGLHVERVGGGCKEGSGAEPVHLGEETLPRTLSVARRPVYQYAGHWTRTLRLLHSSSTLRVFQSSQIFKI
jgi:hypothetical protein